MTIQKIEQELITFQNINDAKIKLILKNLQEIRLNY